MLYVPIYNSEPRRELFELRVAGDLSRFANTRLERVALLTEALRDGAAARLAALPEARDEIERGLVGRRVEGQKPLPPEARIRLIPLPSIGSEHVDRGIRRVLVEVPPENPLQAEDVFWAFSGLVFQSPEGASVIAVASEERRMQDHYGIEMEAGARLWRSVTPVALPLSAARRWIEARRSAEAQGGEERARAESVAARALLQALRHAGVRAPVEHLRVQREPFEGRGCRAPDFAAGTRFEKERLWHVELRFSESVEGPLLLGDGRFLGLGLMAPVREEAGVFSLPIHSGLEAGVPPQVAAEALRRAVMARFQAQIGERAALPSFVSGHGEGDSPADDQNPHLHFVLDPQGQRLLVIAPHVQQHRSATAEERRWLGQLKLALEGFASLRAGAAGLLTLGSAGVDREVDPLFTPAQSWVSLTPYVVNRHRKGVKAADLLQSDLEEACVAIGLPRPRVVVLDLFGVSGQGLTGRAELRFDVAVPGPILLGRTRFKGGGLFVRSVEAL